MVMGPMHHHDHHPYATPATHGVTPPTLGPSEAEAATLTSLAATQTCHPTNVLDVLVRALEICRQEWVYNFVFNTHMSPLGALTAPVNLSAALTCTISATYIAVDDPAAPPSPIAHMLDMHLEGDYIFVPAFSVGALTVGFGVLHFSKTCRAEWGYHVSNDAPSSRLNSTDHFRYVRDDAKSVLLSVQMDERDDVIKLNFFEMLASASRFRAVFTLRMSAFLASLRTQIVPDLVLCANPFVLQCLATTESRPCSVCGAHGGTATSTEGSGIGSGIDSGSGSGSRSQSGTGTGSGSGGGSGSWGGSRCSSGSESVDGSRIGNTSPRSGAGGASGASGAHTAATDCICEVIKHVPKHSYDFSYTTLSMRPYTGAFWGVAKAHYWSNGRQVLAGNVASRMVIQGGEDQSLIQRLSRWAIMENVKYVKEDPLKNIFPTQARPSVHSIDSLDPVDRDGSPLLLRQSFDGVDDDDVAMTCVEERGFSPAVARARHVDGSMISENEDQWQKQQVQVQAQPHNPGSPCFDDIQPVGPVHDEALGAYQVDTRPQPQQPQQPPQLQLELQRSQTPVTQAQLSLVRLGQAPLPAKAHPPAGQSVHPQVVQPQVQPPKSQTEQPKIEKPQIDKPKAQINRNQQRDKRVELRKQRNREAAQRSNLRRKIKNDTLKRELSESNARAIELRAKELLLREENLRLRRKVKRFSTISNKKA